MRFAALESADVEQAYLFADVTLREDEKGKLLTPILAIGIKGA